MDQLSKISDKIADIVDSSDGKTILGVRLGAALKAQFPQFAPTLYQCKNLRQFIRTHVPKVIEKEYTGVDVTYTLSENGPDAVQAIPAPRPAQPPFISLPAEPIAWKAYSNPSYPLTVIANRETGEVKAVGEREVPHDPWVSIPKLASTVHHQIASDFVSGLPDAPKAALTNVLADPQWYVSFFGTTKRLGLSQQWGLFKREHLIRHFTAALQERGITAAPAAPKHDMLGPRPRKSFADTNRQAVADDTNIRELVSRLALSLPIDELRSLRMPLGLVLDALRQ